VPIETRKLLMGHANGDITTHYSAAEKVTDRGIALAPALTLIMQKVQGVGKVSEVKKTNGRGKRRETA